MALTDLYVDGILTPGDRLSDVDEIRIFHPHRTSMSEIVDTLAIGEQRKRLCLESEGLLGWLTEGLATTTWRLWIRGELVSTIRPEPTALDLVVLAAEIPTNGFAWSLRTLACRPYEIDAMYSLDLKVLRGPNFDTLEHDKERRRSSRRCQDDAGEQLVTGWLELLGGGEK